MKKNLFKLFTDKLMDYPLWVKQAVYRKLYTDMKNLECERTIVNTPQKIFALYEPVITYEGENELKNKTKIFDGNIYNFLKLCRENYNILEISLNTFLSIEETAKIFMFCIEQNFIKKPEDIEVYAMCGFIAGKFRTGEYFKEKNAINDEQLNQAINLRNSVDKPMGEILAELRFIQKEDLKNLFVLKSDSKKRFILDSSIFPTSELEITEKEKFEAEISDLKKQNENLKLRMKQLLKRVSQNDD